MEKAEPKERRRRKSVSLTDVLREPKHWGPIYWDAYDVVVKTYPRRPTKRERVAAIQYFSSQKYLIPCKTCAGNYRSIYKQYPPRVESREALQKWLDIVKVEVAKHKAAERDAKASKRDK